MNLQQQLTLLAVLLLTSKGAAGVTGSGFIVLAATLSSVGTLPVAGLALILGIDRFHVRGARADECDRQRRCNPGSSRNGPANSMSSQCAKNSAENGCRSRRLPRRSAAQRSRALWVHEKSEGPVMLSATDLRMRSGNTPLIRLRHGKRGNGLRDPGKG